MHRFFAVDLALNSLEIGVITFTGLGFLIMFGLSSAKGGYQDLVKTTLDNDKYKRDQKKRK